MKSNWVSVLALAACGTVVFMGRSSAQTTVSAPPAPRWEYRFESVWEGIPERRPKSAEDMRTLNELGAQGWEVAARAQGDEHSPDHQYLFKRAIR